MKSKTKSDNKIVPAVETNPLLSPLAVTKSQIEDFKALVKQSMPQFVAEIETKEDFFNATAAAGQEMLLVLEDVLVKKFNFSESDLKKLHDETKDVLTGVREFEKSGLSILSPRDIAMVTDIIDEKGLSGLMTSIADVRLTKEKMNRSGLEYPTLSGAKPFLKELKKRNK